ncbi:MAG: hypothetical protein EP329_06230 [Deltaproteobacteria bacterium]|nr:MAG: hypothetical protein EP329_06230 [Deltaproteobacteria bacterium]
MSARTSGTTRRAPRLRWGVGRLLVLIAFTVVMTGAGIYQVHKHYQLIKVGYALDQDLFEYRRLTEAKKRLQLQLSAYKDPIAVRAFAEDELGMKVPGPEDELHIPRADEGPPRQERLGQTAPHEEVTP